MGPVFEHALVDALGLAQICAPVVGNAAPQDMVVAALDDIDGVDLDIAEMGNGVRHGLRAGTEGCGLIEPLRAQPDAPCFKPGQGVG
jgi:hypothetical protein